MLVNAVLFSIIYLLPLIIALPLIIKIIKWVIRKIQRAKEKYIAYQEWYDNLCPEDKIAEQLKAIKWYIFLK